MRQDGHKPVAKTKGEVIMGNGKRTLKFADAHGLAEKIHAIQCTDKEVSFASCFETDRDGEILESSTGDWWGAKFSGAFDGTYLIIGEYGGGDWYVYDATYGLEVRELEDLLVNLFKNIGAKTVCVEEVEQ